jgi:hypothetical protein
VGVGSGTGVNGSTGTAGGSGKVIKYNLTKGIFE